MVDSHCHLNFKAFENNLDQVIEDAFKAGVAKIINVGTSIESSEKALELAEKYENLYATVGIHPHHADKAESGWAKQLEKLAKNPKVVAIGECGMDFYSYTSNGITNPKLQGEIFIKQIELSYKLKLPLQIHNRQAGKEIIDILLNYKSCLLDPPGVFHCFSGNVDFLKKVLNLGFYIGFDGNLTYKGIAKGENTSLWDLAKYAPLNKIVLETDSPFLTPIPYRGQTNKPEYVIIVAKEIAKIKGITVDKVNDITTENVKKIFNF